MVKRIDNENYDNFLIYNFPIYIIMIHTTRVFL